MKTIWYLAINTYRELIRDRILYGLIVMSLLLLGLSMALGQLSFSEQKRISANFGFAAIQLSSVVLAIFVGSSLVSKEIEKKTVLTLLARPMSRSQFLLGKWLGLSLIVVVAELMLGMALAIVLMGLGMTINESFFGGLFGIFLEAMVLMAISLFLSTFTRPILVVSISLAIFLIGHWVESLKFFVNNSESLGFKVLGVTVTQVFPNLERFNWKSLFIYGDSLNLMELVVSTSYALAWWTFLMSLSSLVLRRKDFV